MNNIKHQLKKQSRNFHNLTWMNLHFNEVLKVVEEYNIKNNLNIKELKIKIWHFINNKLRVPICENMNCTKKVKFKNFQFGYYLYCSRRCMTSCKKIVQKRKNTSLKNYGVDHPLKNPFILNKIKQTNLKKYGVEWQVRSKKTQQKIKQTNLKNYGVEYNFQIKEVQQKIKNTILRKYGVDNFFKSNLIKDKIKKTTLEKYGVEYASQSIEIQNKIKKTTLEKYGVEYVSQSIEIQNKIKRNNIEKYGKDYIDYFYQKSKIAFFNKYGVENPSQLEWIQQKKSSNKDILWPLKIKEEFSNLKFINIDRKTYELTIACNNGHNYKIDNDLLRYRYKMNHECCTICNDPTRNYISEACNDIYNFICANYNGKVILSDNKLIKPKEIDIHIPDLKLAIEYNGVYWHSIKYAKQYDHFNKFSLCLDQNVKLIQIWEDEWLNNPDIIKAKLSVELNNKHIDNTFIQNDIKYDNIEWLSSVFKNFNLVEPYIVVRNNYSCYNSGLLEIT